MYDWSFPTIASHLVEIVLSDAAVFDVKDAFQRLHVKEVHLLQVFKEQRDAAQLFPHQRRQVKVQGLLGANGHAHQDAKKFKLQHVLIQAGRRVEEEPWKKTRLGTREQFCCQFSHSGITSH